MAEATKPSYVVLRQVGDGHWQLVGEARRRPGRTARGARVQAIHDATGGKATSDEVYKAVLRSEWRIASE